MPVLRRHSLAVKLPLGIALLLALACLALTLTAFLQVWRSAFEASSARLSSAARQVAALVEPGLRARVQTVQQIANDPAIRALLINHTPQTEADVLAALARNAQPTGRTDSRVIAPTGETLLATPGWTAQPGDVTPRSPASTGVGLFRKAAGDNHLFYEITAAVLEDQQPVAYLIERRWISERATSIDLLERLIGDDVRLAVGNASGDVWTDFTGPIDPLPATIVSRLETVTGPDRQPAVARGVAVAGTPWLAAVTVPRSSVLAPIWTYLTRALGVTVGVLAVGIAAGWIFSRRITRPLRQLTESAENIAAGKFGERRAHPRGDEIDRLAASFAAMEARVEDARHKLASLVDELESRVKARTADLESANQELEAFSYSVSHDLRAPIRAISGFAAILVEDHGTALSKDARAAVDFIASRSHHMGTLIDDLLSFSLAARQPINQHPIDMAQVSHALTDELIQAAPGRDVDIVIGILPPARGEPVLVRQVLANLLDNAFKFTGPRPIARIEVGSTPIDGQPAYFVRDNGVGFDMRYADRLFGVFQRLHSENEFKGTGVGLAIVQRIVQRHGGRVWAEAAVNQGATFYFTLPRRSGN